MGPVIARTHAAIHGTTERSNRDAGATLDTPANPWPSPVLVHDPDTDGAGCLCHGLFLSTGAICAGIDGRSPGIGCSLSDLFRGCGWGEYFVRHCTGSFWGRTSDAAVSGAHGGSVFRVCTG